MSEPFDRALRAAARRSRATGVCPDAVMLAAYADNGLSADERGQVEAHAADCAKCLEHLALLGAVSVERDTPEMSRSWFAHWGWLVPVATAVLVVAVWIRLPERAPVPAAARQDTPPAAVPYDALPEQENAAAASRRLADQDKSANQKRRGAAIAQSATPGRARPAESKADELASLERRDEARQKAAAPPTAAEDSTALTIGGRAVGQATAQTAPPAAPAMADAAKKEAQGAEFSRRREADLLMSAKTASAPLVVSASPSESYRAVGSRIDLSEDGGATWRSVLSEPPSTFTAAACAAGGSCWFGSADGRLLRRLHNGFSRSALPVRSRVAAIAPEGPQTAIVTVERGQRFRTTDGGATWQPIP